MAVPPAEPTATFDAPGGVPTGSFAPAVRAPRSGFDEELPRLLRSRLLFVHLLSLALMVLMAIMLSFVPRGGYSAPFSLPWALPLLVAIAETLIGAFVLWRRPGLSLRSLR